MLKLFKDKLPGCAESLMKLLNKCLFWNGPIFIMTFGCSQFFISAFASFEKPESKNDLVFAFMTIAIFSIYAAVTGLLIHTKGEKIKDADFEKKFSGLTYDIRKIAEYKSIYPALFVGKKALAAAILIWGSLHMKVYGLMGIQILYIAWLLGQRPLYRTENRVEVFAEYVLLIMAYFSVFYSGYLADPGMLKLIGYCQVAVCMA